MVPNPKLTHLTGQPVVAPGAGLDQASQELLEAMQSEWEEDWPDLSPDDSTER
jgi:hypothetical protein